MMASHGCGGQRIGLGQRLGMAALIALGLSGVPGSARACHYLHHHPRASTDHALNTETLTPTAGTVQSQQVLNPTSMVPQVPPLTPSTAPSITPTAATAPVVTMSPPSAILTPTPVTNPPAAESIVPSAPPAVSAWHDANMPPCTFNFPPPTVPVTTPPASAEGLNPPASLLPPSATATPTPEPSTIVSALVMLGAAAVYRRRTRRVG